MKMRRYGKVGHTGETNPRGRGTEGARVPIISILLLVAFVGIFVAMVTTYVLVPEPTPMPTPKPTPKPTPAPTTGGLENLHFENVAAYANSQSTGEKSYDVILMDVTGEGSVVMIEITATVGGVATYVRSTGGTPIKPGDKIVLVSIEKYMGCGCPQPIVEMDPGDQIRVLVRHMSTRHVFVDTTVTAIGGDKYYELYAL